MLRALISCVALCLLSVAVSTDASRSAIKVFKQTEADAGKVKTYCQMTKAMEAAGDKEDAATDAKIDGYLKQLGPDFTTAWNTGQDMDEKSPDAKAFGDALDELEASAPVRHCHTSAQHEACSSKITGSLLRARCCRTERRRAPIAERPSSSIARR